MATRENAPDEEDERSSGVIPVTKRFPTPIDRSTLCAPIDTRTDEMLARHAEGDHLGALLLAESILWDSPGHGLAGACHAESAEHVRAFLLSKPRRTSCSGDIDTFARLLLASFDGKRTILSLIPTGSDRAGALRAVHDLVRIGFLSLD